MERKATLIPKVLTGKLFFQALNIVFDTLAYS